MAESGIKDIAKSCIHCNYQLVEIKESVDSCIISHFFFADIFPEVRAACLV